MLKCPKCEKSGMYSAVPYPVGGMTTKVNLIQCMHCNTVVGVTEIDSNAYLADRIDKLAKKLNVNLD